MLYIIAALIGLIAILLTLGAMRTIQHPARRATFEAALRAISTSEIQVDTAMNRSEQHGRSWYGHWENEARRAGLLTDNPQQPGNIAIGLLLLGAALGFLVVPGGMLGLFVDMIAAVVLYHVYLRFMQKRRMLALERQLPLLLQALRANLQAGATAQQALLAVADDLPSPLGDEVRELRDEINVSIPMEEALRGLAARVPSREMQFLASSIEIAVRSGADLDPQLGTIEEIVAQRARIRGKLAAAVAQARPTQYIAGVAIPGMFVWGLRAPETRAFWFGTPLGFVVLAVAIILYCAGLYTIRVMVKNVENT